MKPRSNSIDVARHAGVAQSTVSFVLNGRTDRTITDETRRRVLRAAEELGYRPNASARAMRRGRFGCVSLVQSTDRSRSLLPAALLDGIVAVLAPTDVHLNVVALPDEKLTSEGFMPKILREAMSDGLLINYNADIPERMVALVEDHHLPAVWINSRQAADCVHPDDFQAGRQAAEHLLALGHRRVAYFDFSGSSHYSARDRCAGYQTAMQARGLVERVLRTNAPLPRNDRGEFAARWLSGPDVPTAIVAYTPENAYALYCAALERGLSVPRDLSLITFGDRCADDIGRSIDTLLLPLREIGAAAVQMLLGKIENPAPRAAPQVLGVGFLPGQTCAAPP